MACLMIQREQEVPYADSPQHGRQYQALRLGCLCLAQVGGTEGGLIALPLLQGTAKKALTHAVQCFSECFWGKTTVHCPLSGRYSRTQEYQNGHPVKA